ncbi:MAG: leucine-rich repeat domain-containing protein [Lentisphaeria bacterium]|nr:leucine-rich repeat domain-containing protein [Lentisphaeria bacterium]
MTIKCEKCGADVVLADDAKTGKCEKCGAEVTVKEEKAAEAENAEKKPQTAPNKAKTVVEIVIIIAAIAMIPNLCTKLHQHRMAGAGMPTTGGNVKQLMQYENMDQANVAVPGWFNSIGEEAFANNITLKSVTIPSTVKHFGKNAFSGCENLTEVKFEGGAGAYALLDVATLQAFKQGPAAVIEEGAFERCSNLKSFVIPAGTTEIGMDAFGSCKALASVEIPDSVTKLGTRAFVSCTALKKVTVPDSVKTIEKFAFSGCDNLEELSIPGHFTDKDIKSWACPEKCKITKR